MKKANPFLKSMRFSKTALSFILFLGLSLFATRAQAWPPTYGAEFEFTGDDLERFSQSTSRPTDGGIEQITKTKLSARIQERCLKIGCQVIEVLGKWRDFDYKISFPDGFYFTISHDPACVEIQTKPATLEEWKKTLSARMRDVLFSEVEKLGLYANKITGAGHFNTGIKSAFENSGVDFLRFFTDYANHPELALGTIGEDLRNAPPLQMLSDEQKEAFKKLLIKFSNSTDNTFSITEVVQNINTRVYTKSLESDLKSGTHYQAFGLKYVQRAFNSTEANDWPFEWRAVFAQEDPDNFVKLAELQEARILYLRKHPPSLRLIEVKDLKKIGNQQKIDVFYKYVTECGLDWERYKTLMPKSIRSVPVSNLMRGRFRPTPLSIRQWEKWFKYFPDSEFLKNRFEEVLSQDDVRSSAAGEELQSLFARWLASEERLKEEVSKLIPWIKKSAAPDFCEKLFQPFTPIFPDSPK